MRQKAIMILVFLLIGHVDTAMAGDDGVWVGKRFRPERCLEIVEGKYDIKHKLCTISYQIRSDNGQFAIEGRLRFNKAFIPKNVSEVELEILLIDENRVCTKQLNQRKEVEAREVSFAFVADKLPSQRYVRTYYIIYYRNAALETIKGGRISFRCS